MEFLQSLSIASFKELHKATDLDIVKSPITSKLFVAVPGNSGSVATVSSKLDKSKPMQFTECKGDDDATFWCLCNIKQDNVVMSL